MGQVKRRDRVPERVRPGVLEARAPDEAVPLVLEGAVRLGPDQLGDHGKAVERPDPHLAKPHALQLEALLDRVGGAAVEGDRPSRGARFRVFLDLAAVAPHGPGDAGGGGAAEAQPARPHPQHLLGPHAAREEQQRLDLEGAQGERVSATVKTTNFAIAL